MTFIKYATFCLLLVALSQIISAKYTVKKLDKDVKKQLKSYNKTRIKESHGPIVMSSDLKKIAQHEAERFAENSELIVPEIKTEKAYVAFMFKITDKVNGNWGNLNTLEYIKKKQLILHF